MEFFDTIRQVKSNWASYKIWEVEQQKKEKQNEELRKKYPPTPQELEHAKQYGRTIVDCINIMDQHSIDKSEDAAFVVKNVLVLFKNLLVGVGVTLGSLSLLSNKVRQKPELALYSQIIGAISGAMAASIFGNIWGATTEKQASRIARYQTRENDLKDSRNFVIYNEDQIKEAEEIAKSLPEIKEKRKELSLKRSLNPIETFSKAKETTDELRKDYKKYNIWKQKYLQEELDKKVRFQQMNPSQEELSKAQKDRDVLLGTIKKIENSSLNYLMDMKLALFSVLILLATGGLTVGLISVKLMDQLQKTKKLNIDPTKLNIAKIGGLKFLPIIPILLIIGPMIKLIKDSARIGRYKAKQELLSNPLNFVVYDENQRKTVTLKETPKSKKRSFWTTLKQDLNSIKQFKKDYDEYHTYMNTKHKEELKLQEALKMVNISETQKNEAIKLQKNAFHSFEKMDEKAQRYIDDTDAAIDITLNVISSILTGVTRIFSISLLLKKLEQYNKGGIKEGVSKLEDIPKALKYFKGADIIKIILPLFAPAIINVPLAIKGIQIKKEAGKIGVMQAMKDLDDPKNFIDSQNSD